MKNELFQDFLVVLLVLTILGVTFAFATLKNFFNKNLEKHQVDLRPEEKR